MYRDQQLIDADHLKLLSIFHFIGAGFAVLGLLFVFVHFAVMRIVFTNPEIWQNASPAPPAEILNVFKWFYLLAALWMIASAVLNLLSGLFLRTGKHRRFSFIVAGMNCIHIPLGTILGVLTFIVLMRPSVQFRCQSVSQTHSVAQKVTALPLPFFLPYLDFNVGCWAFDVRYSSALTTTPETHQLHVTHAPHKLSLVAHPHRRDPDDIHHLVARIHRYQTAAC